MESQMGKLLRLAVAVTFILRADSSTHPAKTEAKATHTQSDLPEDTSQKLLVKKIKVSGNTLVSAAELSENLPAAFTVSAQKERTTDEQFYDSRVLHEIILVQGQECEVPKKTIQGSIQYLLSVYQEIRKVIFHKS